MPSPDLYRVGCFIHFLPGLAAGRHLAGAVNWLFLRPSKAAIFNASTATQAASFVGYQQTKKNVFLLVQTSLPIS